MQILLPINKKTGTQITLEDVKSIVFIGANGSGKTRMGSKIEQTYDDKTHRISAQKSLSMPDEASPTTKEISEIDFFYGNPTHGKSNKRGYRWGNKPNTFLLNDYQKLMVLLHTDEYEESIKFKEEYNPGQKVAKPITKLDRIQKNWEFILPHRKLIKKASKIETYPTGRPEKIYNASEMSDGERVIFYLIGEVVSVPKNSILVIDEPEMHIHKSITKKLWDAIEKERPDCTFIYLTHDIDFATSRYDAIKIWLKSYEDNQVWDYEILDEKTPIPEQVYLEILGSRNTILFTEGDNSSIDYFLYQQIFPELTITPLGNCNKVFEATKSFNELNTFHNLLSVGIIDRDRRTDDDIKDIRSQGIFVTEVAETENLLLLEKVIKIVAKRMFKNPDDVFNQVKINVISLFKDQYQYQATQHSIFKIKKSFERGLNPKVKEFSELEREVNFFLSGMDYESTYLEIETLFRTFIDKTDYINILKVFNNKGIIQTSGLAQLCGLNSKNNEFLNFVIGILKENSDDSNTIRREIREMIEVK